MQNDNEAVLSKRFSDCIRVLSADGVEKAKSGHPGICMGAADIMYVLWQNYLKFNPQDPAWINRDRFILSAGHGSMLLYTMLHIYGYDVSLDDLKNFRQLKSKTPGHPEYGVTPGVETSTGPLGQGVGNAAGMAIAYEMLKSKLSKNGSSPLNHKTYVLCGDGDIMEGISSEAGSLAGHLALSNLVVIYDDNCITIEGKTDLAFSENVEQKFKAFNWEVIKIDGHNYDEINKALKFASGQNSKPVLIISRTTIAKGSFSFEGSNKSHGSPLGEDELIKTKKKLCLPENESFCVFKDLEENAKKRIEELKVIYNEWNNNFAKFLADNPDINKQYDDFLKGHSFDVSDLTNLANSNKPAATRASSGAVMQYIASKIPGFTGGSADLSPSTNTFLKDWASFSKDNRAGKNLHFGVREHIMGAVLNGIAIYGNFLPFGSTFLVFSDYMKPAIRLSAMMKLHVVYIFTHDSFFVGEDGPTHQPLEHVWGLRSIPNLDVIRPADSQETAVAWAQAVNNDKNPTALILTRQNVPQIDRSKYAPSAGLLKGGYVISPESNPSRIDVIIIASGSEVSPALEVKQKLENEGLSARVVSMPSLELFEKQDSSYRDKVIDPRCRKRVVIEAGIPGGWYKYTGIDGLVIGIDNFGASAPATVLCEKYGFTVEKLYQKIKIWL